MWHNIRILLDKYNSKIGPDFEDSAWHALFLGGVIAVTFDLTYSLSDVLQTAQAACAKDKTCKKSTRCLLKGAYFSLQVLSLPVNVCMLAMTSLVYVAMLLLELVAGFMDRAMDVPLYGVTRLTVVAIVLVITPERCLDIMKSALMAPHNIRLTAHQDVSE